MKKLLFSLCFIFGAVLLGFQHGISNPVAEADTVFAEKPDPRKAMLRSFAVPGWGHIYATPENRTKGFYYLTADVVFLGSVIILTANSRGLERNMYTFVRTWAQTDIEGRDRAFQLAVGNYNSFTLYNNFQESTFNWDRMFEETTENFWEWESNEKRMEYRDMRARRDQLDRQVPAIIGLMVANRLISGISAYLYTKNENENMPDIGFNMRPQHNGDQAIMGIVRFRL